MADSRDIISLKHPGLPDDLIAGIHMEFAGKASDGVEKEIRKTERTAGRQVIETLVRINFGEGELKISGRENEKPVGVYNHQPLYISISHTHGVAAGVISRERNLGIDLEKKNRRINPALEKRIIHSKEESLIRSLPVIQLWTLKEAALKWHGTGLRLSMNKVRVTDREGECFSVLIKDTYPLKVCSFAFNSHWVSIAFDP